MVTRTPFPPSHPLEGEAVDPQEGYERDEGDAENDSDDDAGTDIRILARIVGELAYSEIARISSYGVLELCGSETTDEQREEACVNVLDWRGRRCGGSRTEI